MQHAIKNKQTGSALLVVVAFLALIGVSVALGAGDFGGSTDEVRERETKAEMDFISSSIAAYVQRYDRLPCPAAPDVLPTNSIPGTGFGYEDRLPGGVCNPATTSGLVPFRTLQIPEKYSRDEWGRYYSFSVSQAFAQYNGSVYWSCRTADWYETNAGIDYHLNPIKASFCCAPVPTLPTDDVEVFGTAVIALEPPTPRRVPPNPAPIAGTYATPSDGPGRIVSAPIGTTNIRAAVYALISHGRNGLGSFLANGTTNFIPVPGAITDPEVENSRQPNRTFFARNQVLSETSANYFDDLVVYKNQYQVYSQLGGGSCARAWR